MGYMGVIKIMYLKPYSIYLRASIFGALWLCNSHMGPTVDMMP